jgi:hypothetical protein
MCNILGPALKGYLNTSALGADITGHSSVLSFTVLVRVAGEHRFFVQNSSRGEQVGFGVPIFVRPSFASGSSGGRFSRDRASETCMSPMLREQIQESSDRRQYHD